MSTFTTYLPDVESAILEQLVDRSGLKPNRVVRLALRSLYLFGAEHGFAELESALALEAGRIAADETLDLPAARFELS